MKTISSGPDHEPRHIGTKVTVSKAEAARLIVGGFAEYTGPEKAVIQPKETAIVKPPEREVVAAPETAEEKPQKGKGKK
jgi:hypothetical protein